MPVLGICYGLQLMAYLLGGRVERGEAGGEYGRAKVRVERAAGVLGRLAVGDSIEVWMSHGDRLTALPPGFEAHRHGGLARRSRVPSPTTRRRLYGIQVHPEVAHTPRGREILDAFLFDVAGLTPTWTAASFVDHAIAAVRAKVGRLDQRDPRATGGVDSSVAAVLCQRALGERLTCIFVDNGLLRQREAEGVVRMFGDHFSLRLVHVDAGARFLRELKGVTDPEKK